MNGHNKGDALTEHDGSMGYDTFAPFFSTLHDDIILINAEVEALPCGIDLSRSLCQAFGASEDEQAAMILIEFRQPINQWEPFTYEEINAFWQKHPRCDREVKTRQILDSKYTHQHNRFLFWGLLLRQYIAFDYEGYYYFTKSFVQRCIKSNVKFPKKSATA